MITTFTSGMMASDSDFLNKLISSGEYLFKNANMITLYDNYGKIAKGLIDNDTKTAYYVIKEDNMYSIYYHNIFSYVTNHHSDPKDILSHTLLYGGIKEDEKLKYIPAYSILKYKREYDFDANVPMPENLLKMSNPEIAEYIKTFRKKLVPDINGSISIIRNYVDMYSTYNNDFVITDEKLISYMKDARKAYQSKMDDIKLRFKFIDKLDQYTKDNPFEFNDLDNYIWKQDGLICLEDQNLVYVCKFIDDDNFKVMSIIIDDIPNDMTKDQYVDKIIAEFDTSNSIKDKTLVYENGKITFIDESLYYVFESDIVYGVTAIEEELGVSHLEGTDIDTSSVEYMRNSIYTLYQYDRFAFCNQVFLVLGSGYDYNPIAGSYENRYSQYRTDLLECPLECKPRNNLYGPFNDYIKITYLNDEWKEELKWFYNKIKELPEDTESIGNRHSVQEILSSIEPFIQ